MSISAPNETNGDSKNTTRRYNALANGSRRTNSTRRFVAQRYVATSRYSTTSTAIVMGGAFVLVSPEYTSEKAEKCDALHKTLHGAVARKKMALRPEGGVTDVTAWPGVSHAAPVPDRA